MYIASKIPLKYRSGHITLLLKKFTGEILTSERRNGKSQVPCNDIQSLSFWPCPILQPHIAQMSGRHPCWPIFSFSRVEEMGAKNSVFDSQLLWDVKWENTYVFYPSNQTQHLSFLQAYLKPMVSQGFQKPSFLFCGTSWDARDYLLGDICPISLLLRSACRADISRDVLSQKIE